MRAGSGPDAAVTNIVFKSDVHNKDVQKIRDFFGRLTEYEESMGVNYRRIFGETDGPAQLKRNELESLRTDGPNEIHLGEVIERHRLTPSYFPRIVLASGYDPKLGGFRINRKETPGGEAQTMEEMASAQHKSAADYYYVDPVLLTQTRMSGGLKASVRADFNKSAIRPSGVTATEDLAKNPEYESLLKAKAEARRLVRQVEKDLERTRGATRAVGKIGTAVRNFARAAGRRFDRQKADIPEDDPIVDALRGVGNLRTVLRDYESQRTVVAQLRERLGEVRSATARERGGKSRTIRSRKAAEAYREES